jgi:TolB protein
MRVSPLLRTSLIGGAILLVFISSGSSDATGPTVPIGVFESQGDIGTVLHSGSAQYDSAHDIYTVTGSGANMWFDEDDFHFVWKKVSGDVSLGSDIDILGKAGAPHRKGVLMIRQSLDSNSAFVDVVLHAVGKSSLQFRETGGAAMHTIASNVYFPRRIKIEKRGDYFYGFLSGKDGKLEPSGASTRVLLKEPFYVGIGVCAHDKDALQTVRFSNVQLTVTRPTDKESAALFSTLETVSVGTIKTLSSDRQVEYVTAGRLEAPNWSRDSSFFIFNRDGRLFRAAVICGAEDVVCAGRTAPTEIGNGLIRSCTSNHGISPDGQMLAISCQGQKAHGPFVYTVPIGEPTMRQVTRNGPSFWGGWSPDGAALVFTGIRKGEAGIYRVSQKGGEETRLATNSGPDDGPEYSPDGHFIYFSSGRTGTMQIWRVGTDGGAEEQVTSDAYNDWFPHISPDGRWLVFLSYENDVKGHPPNQAVRIQLMSLEEKKVRVLATLLGGQGTIDAPSWSPDSKKIAFVSYEFLPESAKAN